MSFPQYPEYKESGVEWLGAVPAHWTLPPLASRYQIALGKMLDEKRITGEHLVPYLRNIDVQWDRINVEDLPKMDVGPHEHERYLLRNGDLLVCEGGEVGRAAIWLNDLAECAYQKALHRLRPHDAGQDPRYLFYTLRFAVDRGVFEANGNPNTILHLTGQQFRTYRFPNPPADEQREVAAFLDRETAKIDALVAEQERLIELLQEKRQAVISHAVTKGLNPDVPMKDSGVEWLGTVPTHWSVCSLRSLARDEPLSFVDGDWIEAPYITDQGIRLIQTGNIGVGQYKEQGYRFVSEQTFRDLKCTEVEPGDILICRLAAPVGRACRAPALDARMITSVDVCILKPSPAVDADFLTYLLSSAEYLGYMEGQCRGGTRDRVSRSFLGRVRVCMPPTAEQREIAAGLNARTAEIDQLRREQQRGIDLLMERRAALITAAVTGQIDVRGLAPAEAA